MKTKVIALVCSVLLVAPAPAALALTNTSLPIYGAASGYTSGTLERLFGDNRYETAIKVNEFHHGAQGIASRIVVASGESFADALSSAPLAAVLNAPLFLTPKGSLPSEVASAIKWVFDGVKDTEPDLYLIGGIDAISETVEQQLVSLNPNLEVFRRGGSSRDYTSSIIGDELTGLRGAMPTSVFIANGLSYPDALSASAPASDGSLETKYSPIILNSNAKQLTSPAKHDVEGYLQNGLKNIYLIGGQSVLEQSITDELNQLIASYGATTKVVQIGGEDRFHTAVAVADYFYPTPEFVGVASGESFADAMVGGLSSGKAGSVSAQQAFLLTKKDVVPSVVADFLSRHAESLSAGLLYGGPAAVSDNVKAQIETYL
jgi:putative cell wall-binding protein